MTIIDLKIMMIARSCVSDCPRCHRNLTFDYIKLGVECLCGYVKYFDRMKIWKESGLPGFIDLTAREKSTDGTLYERKCVICGKPFRTNYTRKILCSVGCRDERGRRKNAELMAKKRALKIREVTI
jgi:predicted nucleic acid-binding Zn ribbon protein